MNNNYLFIMLRLLIVLFLCVVTFYFLKITLFYLYPFIIAFFLSLIFNPIVTYIEHQFKLSRQLATIISIFVFFVISILITIFLGLYIFEETLYILQLLPTYIDELLHFSEAMINNVITFFNDHILSLFNTLPISQQTVIMKYINELLTQLSELSSNVLNTIMLNLTNTLTSLSYVMTVLLIIFISLFFITNDLTRIQKRLIKLLPDEILKHINEFHFYFKRATLGLIKAHTLIAFISAIIIFISLLLFKIEHALTISLFAFFIDFIPYAGVGMIFIPWLIYSFFISNYLLTIQLALLYMVLIVIRQLIEPKILASSIGISPLITLIILFVSFKKWGLFGLAISPFLLIVISTANHSGLFYNIWRYIKG